MRVPCTGEARGSQRWIQAAVNDRSDFFGQVTVDACDFPPGTTIEWVSPRRNDDYAEYRDEAFLDLLGIELHRHPITDFWPKRGPQWDALGRTDNGQYLLLEAKANIREVVSSATAASEISRSLIDRSLEETKAFLQVNDSIPWAGKLYQYANRLAHLYLLRQLNDIPAHLVFVYFVGDRDVNGPKTVAEWKAALTVAKAVLGIPERHALSRFVHDVYVDVADLRS